MYSNEPIANRWRLFSTDNMYSNEPLQSLKLLNTTLNTEDQGFKVYCLGDSIF